MDPQEWYSIDYFGQLRAFFGVVLFGESCKTPHVNNEFSPQPRILPRPPLGLFYEPPGCSLPAGPVVHFGVIGLGPWGREIIGQLNQMPNAPVVAICDHYPAAIRRGAELAPKAAQIADYRRMAESEEVKAIVVATPTHLHREIVIAALQAGKHVYCESPLAHTIEDARAIAKAARDHKVIFQSGLQLRRNPHRRAQLAVIRGGGLGRPFLARAQAHRKRSWASTAPESARERELNWRLQKETSTGLVGEIGIHQIDLFCWYLNSLPTSVRGTGSLMEWYDGRTLPDTVFAVFKFPDGAHLNFEATLANSFENECEFLHGNYGTLMMRGNRSWLFKESDAPLTAWEDWARREYLFGQLGLRLRVGPDEDAYPNAPLYYALEAFATRVGLHEQGRDLSASGLKLDLAPGWNEGFQATVLAIKANEAIQRQQEVNLSPERFVL